MIGGTGVEHIFDHFSVALDELGLFGLKSSSNFT
jgi:hypothetical protein